MRNLSTWELRLPKAAQGQRKKLNGFWGLPIIPEENMQKYTPRFRWKRRFRVPEAHSLEVLFFRSFSFSRVEPSWELAASVFAKFGRRALAWWGARSSLVGRPAKVYATAFSNKYSWSEDEIKGSYANNSADWCGRSEPNYPPEPVSFPLSSSLLDSVRLWFEVLGQNPKDLWWIRLVRHVAIVHLHP